MHMRHALAPCTCGQRVLEGGSGLFECLPRCLAIALLTSLLTMSPATMPRTPPRGFCKAVSLPMRMTSSGMLPLDNSSAARNKRDESFGDSRSDLMCSMVIPERPPAAPRLAVRRHFKNVSWSNTNGARGWNALASSERSSLARGGW